MFKSIKLRFILVLIFLIVSVIFCIPNVLEPKGKWKEYLPSDKIHLGLDLKGGMHLLLEMDTLKMMDNVLDRRFNHIKDAMIREGIRFLDIIKKDNGLSIVIKQEQKDKLYNLIGKDFTDFKAGGQKAEGENLIVDFILSEKDIAHIKDNALNQALETIRNRIDQFGVTEPVIVKQGDNQILVQLPGIKDPQRALELIGRTAQLEFKLVDEENMSRYTGGPPPEGDEVLSLKTKNRETGIVTTAPILLKKQSLLTGDFLTDAKVKIGGEFNNEPYVAIEFNSEGARIFDKITAENVGKRIAIILDNTVYSAPVVKERISGGKASITGGFTMDEAKDLAIVLRAGALPAPVKVVQNITI
ncbi:MAG TPA: protein translocase subunit SecD, partial [Syntrophorhabdaceae bacterium]|nr:protein translocase subunit SecD [Syntrophorhabdaceae bacterium]